MRSGWSSGYRKREIRVRAMAGLRRLVRSVNRFTFWVWLPRKIVAPIHARPPRTVTMAVDRVEKLTELGKRIEKYRSFETAQLEVFCVARQRRRASYKRRAPENGRISAVNTKHMAMLVLVPESS